MIKTMTAGLLVLAMVGPIPTMARAQDIFIGTVKIEQDQVVLTRCDLVGNRYVLKDGAPEQPVAALAARLATLKPPVQAEVIGEYEAEGDGNALRVIDVQNVQAGKTCHLLDVIATPGAPDVAPR